MPISPTIQVEAHCVTGVTFFLMAIQLSLSLNHSPLR
jgi:hypothetical protein